MLLRLARTVVPRSWRLAYHRALALAAARRFGYPSRSLTVIGVTGTDGKTTTATMIAAILEAAGHRVGLSSSVWHQAGPDRWLNESHLTMPGRFALQRLLRRMVSAGCAYAVLEVSSEGIAQHRLRGIEIDAAVVTNVTPEHVEAHGDFERYKAMKGKLFAALRHEPKRVNGKAQPTIAVVNLDMEHAPYFLEFPADEKYGTTLKNDQPDIRGVRAVAAHDIKAGERGSTFAVEGNPLAINLPGRYNVSNALEAVAVTRALGIPWEAIRQGLADLPGVPGRFDEIASEKGFSVIIDYALTPAALEEFFRTVKERDPKRIIAVFGAAGGGRDRWKRPRLGEIASKYADHIILTTDDPYDEDPAKICADLKAGIPAMYPGGLEIVLNRREAIATAVSLAKPGDIVTVTGMGAETSMNMAGGKKVPWSDAQAVNEALGRA